MMRIVDMVNGKFEYATPTQSNQNTVQSSTAFDMLLTEAGRRNNVERSENPNRNREDGERNSRRADETRRNDQATRRRENRQSEESTNVAAATAYASTVTANYAADESAVDESKAIGKIAEIMQVPEEVVAEWLKELGLTAQDLKDPSAVSKMLQLALDAENPAELLNNAKFPELYKAINEVVAELPKEVASKVDALAESLQGLEVTEENGNLVVAEKNNATNSEQQSSTNSDVKQNVSSEAVVENADDALLVTDEALLKADDAIADKSQAANPAMNIEAAVAKATQSVQASSQQPVNATDVIEQIMNQVKVSNSGGTFSELRMTLSPESLGDIVLRVITQNGIVTAQFEAESQRVKEALEASFNLLRDALAEQGIKFSELSVNVRQDDNERMGQFERARQGSRHRAESIGEVTEADVEEVSYHNGVIDVTA